MNSHFIIPQYLLQAKVYYLLVLQPPRECILKALRTVSKSLPHRRYEDRLYTIQSETIHLAMYLYDMFVEKFVVKESRAGFVAVVALSIAGRLRLD